MTFHLLSVFRSDTAESWNPAILYQQRVEEAQQGANMAVRAEGQTA
jgi:hypothetical protein